MSEEIRWKGPDALRALLVPIGDLRCDPANVRVHPQRNLDAIAASLARFGQQKPVVADPDGIVRAGNGTLESARSLGWTHVAAVASNLSGSEATAYGIADNRTTDLSTFSELDLANLLKGLDAENFFDLEATGFTSGEIDDLLGKAESDADGQANQDDATDQAIPEKFEIVVECESETHQREAFDFLTQQGYSCRVLTF